MAQEEKGQQNKQQQSLPEKGVEKGGEMVGKRFGGPVGGWVGGKIAKKAAPIIGPLLVIFPLLFFFIILIPVIVVVVILLGGSSAAVSPLGDEDIGSVLTVSKSPNPTNVDNNGLGSKETINFVITIQNNSDNLIKNIYLSDDKCPDITDTIDELDSKRVYTKTFPCEIDTDRNYIYENTVTVSGDLEKVTSIGGNAPTIDQCISFQDFSADEEQMVRVAIEVPAAYPKWMDLLCADSSIGKTVNIKRVAGGTINGFVDGKVTLTLYDGFFGLGSGLNTTTAAGRAFVITHELTHVISNKHVNTLYQQFLDDPAVDQEFQDKFVIRSYPLCFASTGTCDGVDPHEEDFAEMAGNFIGDREGTSINFSSEYPAHFAFAQDHLFGEEGSTEQTTLEPVSAQATAYVIVGDAEGAPPAYAPLTGGVWKSGYDFGDPVSYRDDGHQGIDISTTTEDWNIYSPFAGPAWVEEAREDPDGYGWYVVLRSGEWYVRMAHIEPNPPVSQGQVVPTDKPLGVMDDTGLSEGDHVHYEVGNGSIFNVVDPRDYNGFKPHP